MNIADRIRKLLNLSGSGNTNEAALAAAEAQRLMDLHGVEAASLSEAQASPVDESHFKSRDIWLASLAAAVARSFFCVSWRGDGKIVICGRKTDMEAAMVLTEWLRLQIESECRKEIFRNKCNGVTTSARTFRNSFCHGAVLEIARRLKERAKPTVSDAGAPGSATALTVTQTEALARYAGSATAAIAAYKASKGVYTISSRPKFRANRDAYTAGMDAGARASMTAPNRALTGR